MKPRKVMMTFDAMEIHKQLANVKHKRGQQLLRSKLVSTYIESFVDLEKKRSFIMTLNDVSTKKIWEAIDEMVKHIITTYGIKEVKVYGEKEFTEEYKSGRLEWYLSSIIRPEIEGTQNDIPSVVYDLGNGFVTQDPLELDKESKEKADLFFDVQDSTVRSFGLSPVMGRGPDEAGEIRIIIQTLEEVEREYVKPETHQYGDS